MFFLQNISGIAASMPPFHRTEVFLLFVLIARQIKGGFIRETTKNASIGGKRSAVGTGNGAESAVSAQTALWYLEQDSRVGDQRPGGICGRGCLPESPGQSIWEVFWCFLRLGVWDLGSQTSAPSSGSRES